MAPAEEAGDPKNPGGPKYPGHDETWLESVRARLEHIVRTDDAPAPRLVPIDEVPAYVKAVRGHEGPWYRETVPARRVTTFDFE